MPEILSCWVDGHPKAQPRVKAFRRGAHAGVYDPGTADNWKLAVAAAVKAAWNKEQHTGPLRLTLRFMMPRPKAHFGKSGQIKETAPHYQTSKPDLDNLAKAVMDALTQLQVWKDDSQIVQLWVSKPYTEKQAGCWITLDHVE